MSFFSGRPIFTSSFFLIVLVLLPSLFSFSPAYVAGHIQFANHLTVEDDTKELWQIMKNRMLDRGAFVVAGSHVGYSIDEARNYLKLEAENHGKMEDPAISKHPAERELSMMNMLQQLHLDLDAHRDKNPVAKSGKLEYSHCTAFEANGYERLAKHCRIMIEFGCTDDWSGFMRTVSPAVDVNRYIRENLGYNYVNDNPLLKVWCTWAQDAQYIDPYDARVLGTSYGLFGFAIRKQLMTNMFSYGVPTKNVMRKMVQLAPRGRITEIGGYPGYWAQLLKANGADIEMVDPIADGGASVPDVFYETKRVDAAKYIADRDGLKDRALLFVWPHNQENGSVWVQNVGHDDSQTYAYKCLQAYKGDVVLFVGETHGGVTFNIHRYMSVRKWVWKKVSNMKVPTWPGFDDTFLAYRRIHSKKKKIREKGRR